MQSSRHGHVSHQSQLATVYLCPATPSQQRSALLALHHDCFQRKHSTGPSAAQRDKADAELAQLQQGRQELLQQLQAMQGALRQSMEEHRRAFSFLPEMAGAKAGAVS